MSAHAHTHTHTVLWRTHVHTHVLPTAKGISTLHSYPLSTATPQLLTLHSYPLSTAIHSPQLPTLHSYPLSTATHSPLAESTYSTSRQSSGNHNHLWCGSISTFPSSWKKIWWKRTKELTFSESHKNSSHS